MAFKNCKTLLQRRGAVNPLRNTHFVEQVNHDVAVAQRILDNQDAKFSDDV